MVKPVDSKSPHRPLRKESEGRSIKLPATIVTAGHVSSEVRIGPDDSATVVRLPNALLRLCSGEDL